MNSPSHSDRPGPDTVAIELDHEDVDWLSTLLAQYRAEHDAEADEDPSATREMLDRCERAIKALRRIYPFDAAVDRKTSVRVAVEAAAPATTHDDYARADADGDGHEMPF